VPPPYISTFLIAAGVMLTVLTVERLFRAGVLGTTFPRVAQPETVLYQIASQAVSVSLLAELQWRGKPLPE
jgi:hypothetical protein